MASLETTENYLSLFSSLVRQYSNSLGYTSLEYLIWKDPDLSRVNVSTNEFQTSGLIYLFHSVKSNKYLNVYSGREVGSSKRNPSYFERAMSTLSFILRAAEPWSMFARITSGVMPIGISSNFSKT